MKVTKLGHCCTLVEVDNLRIITDPGGWSNLQPADMEKIDIVLITHEHADHIHMESLKEIIAKNPKVTVITNSGVGKLLEPEQIKYELIEHNQNNTISGILIEGFGEMHKEVYQEFGMVKNTGYFIANKFFYPGDALTNPNKPTELLALPVVGPWLDIKDAIDYAKELKPKKSFPVHDGFLAVSGPFHYIPSQLLPAEGIEFIAPANMQDRIVIEL
jgi:L-ascorbate metabolism protein UlaG (beta-lactamase superfamily)